ncbi:MAG: hypothetical protein HKO02_09485 [Hyphomonadaceae bacterium]|nr:hypothetical protein [Hyphomonadaceae bacterium]
MKLLLTTTAIAVATCLANPAVASVDFTESNSVYAIDITLASQAPETLNLVADTKSFYRGDFLSVSNAKLKTLTQSDLYNGTGGAEVPTIRNVTD